MASLFSIPLLTTGVTKEQIHKDQQRSSDIILCELAKERGWLSEHVHQYKDFWYIIGVLQGLLALQQYILSQNQTCMLMLSV